VEPVHPDSSRFSDCVRISTPRQQIWAYWTLTNNKKRAKKPMNPSVITQKTGHHRTAIPAASSWRCSAASYSLRRSCSRQAWDNSCSLLTTCTKADTNEQKEAQMTFNEWLTLLINALALALRVIEWYSSQRHLADKSPDLSKNI
jgi:heme/copper-type cytochrome/quinol oxidase subunit 3